MERIVTLPDGTELPAIGQGTWFLGERRNLWEQEKETLLTGIENGITLTSIAQSHNATISQILLAFAIRSGQVIAIPRTATPAHAAENSSAMNLALTVDELAQIDREYPASTRKVRLDIV